MTWKRSGILKSVAGMAIVICLLWRTGYAAVDSVSQTDTSKVQHSLREGIGLGIILGEETGLSAKKWVGNITAVDGAISWSFGDVNMLYLHFDYLFHRFDQFEKVKRGKLLLYYGVGGKIKLKNKSEAGLRIPVGVNYVLKEAPLDAFTEIIPGLDLIPSTGFSLGIAIGVRYFFVF